MRRASLPTIELYKPQHILTLVIIMVKPAPFASLNATKKALLLTMKQFALILVESVSIKKKPSYYSNLNTFKKFLKFTSNSSDSIRKTPSTTYKKAIFYSSSKIMRELLKHTIKPYTAIPTNHPVNLRSEERR